MSEEPIVVFISYSHDSDPHCEAVLALSERLRNDGVNTRLDQYVEGSPAQGWPRWMQDQLDDADFVLVICTETYYRRFRGHEEPPRGQGADWEGMLISQEIYDARSETLKFVPVLLDADQKQFIPEPLRRVTHYTLTSEEGYSSLYDFLLGQAGVEPGPLGHLKRKPRHTGTPAAFSSHTRVSSEPTDGHPVRPLRLRVPGAGPPGIVDLGTAIGLFRGAFSCAIWGDADPQEVLAALRGAEGALQRAERARLDAPPWRRRIWLPEQDGNVPPAGASLRDLLEPSHAGSRLGVLRRETQDPEVHDFGLVVDLQNVRDPGAAHGWAGLANQGVDDARVAVVLVGHELPSLPDVPVLQAPCAEKVRATDDLTAALLGPAGPHPREVVFVWAHAIKQHAPPSSEDSVLEGVIEDLRRGGQQPDPTDSTIAAAIEGLLAGQPPEGFRAEDLLDLPWPGEARGRGGLLGAALRLGLGNLDAAMKDRAARSPRLATENLATLLAQGPDARLTKSVAAARRLLPCAYRRVFDLAEWRPSGGKDLLEAIGWSRDSVDGLLALSEWGRPLRAELVEAVAEVADADLAPAWWLWFAEPPRVEALEELLARRPMVRFLVGLTSLREHLDLVRQEHAVENLRACRQGLLLHRCGEG